MYTIQHCQIQQLKAFNNYWKRKLYSPFSQTTENQFTAKVKDIIECYITYTEGHPIE